ncbi:MAG: hypothetical protein CMJ67_00810 [Planctomycetaceae bacterium]|nr:hypothetical protein [Planctomycetaceae bacterium]
MKVNGFPNINGSDEGFFSGLTDSFLSAWEGLFGLYYDQGPIEVPTATGLLNGFLPILLVSFVVTLIVVPIARWVAVQYGIVDDPDGIRKVHRYPIAYLGGAGIFAGVVAGIVAFDPLITLSSGIDGFTIADYSPVPFAVVFGIFAIFITGVLDDIFHWDPRLKLAGQLVAASALALSDFGTGAATGLMSPFFSGWIDGYTTQVPTIIGGVSEYLTLWGVDATMPADVNQWTWSRNPFRTLEGIYYWSGVLLIGIVVLGACNAANLIDGLDGLLTGTVGTMAFGFLAVAIILAIGDVNAILNPQVTMDPTYADRSYDPFAGSRIVIALALLGACLGFLPYNFNPAVIFLGDGGSLLMGFLCGVLILSLGSEGQTHYVIAGLIIFALPIMDTLLAILRRKLAGLPMSEADKNHIHHMFLRGFGGNVKKAVFALYGLNAVFVFVGVSLAATVAIGGARYLLAYGTAILIFGFVGAVALKIGLRQRWAMQASESSQSKG